MSDNVALLRAMARNYGDGPHAWDRLDKEACQHAADEITRLRAERDEADRRAGAAEREMASLKEDARKRRWWLDSAKEARGYGMYDTFDRVWAETCAKADQVSILQQQNEALQEALLRVSNRPTPSHPEGERA